MILILKLSIKEEKLLFFITNLRAFCIHFLQILPSESAGNTLRFRGKFQYIFQTKFFSLGIPSVCPHLTTVYHYLKIHPFAYFCGKYKTLSDSDATLIPKENCPNDPKTIAWLLIEDCLTTTWRIPRYLMNATRLPGGCLDILKKLLVFWMW